MIATLALLAALSLTSAESSAPVSISPYEAGYMELLDTGKPLVVWVRFDCPACRRAMPDCNHVHLPTFAGDATPRVIVNVRHTDGKAYYFGDLRDGVMGAERIRRKIAESVDALQPELPAASAPTYFAPSIPAFAAPAQMRGGSRSC